MCAGFASLKKTRGALWTADTAGSSGLQACWEVTGGLTRKKDRRTPTGRMFIGGVIQSEDNALYFGISTIAV